MIKRPEPPRPDAVYCPFCGYDRYTIHKDTLNNRGEYAECDRCLARGPCDKDPDHAWKTRSTNRPPVTR